MREPKRHVVKSHPKPFAAVVAGLKKHETRVADRDYQVGDTLVLSEWIEEEQRFTGQTHEVLITFITPPGTWGPSRRLVRAEH